MVLLDTDNPMHGPWAALSSPQHWMKDFPEAQPGPSAQLANGAASTCTLICHLLIHSLKRTAKAETPHGHFLESSPLCPPMPTSLILAEDREFSFEV